MTPSIGGRSIFWEGEFIPCELELSRSKEKTSSIALEWKLPRRAFEVIPRRNLSPNSVPETFVLQTPFPPDDRSVGYERGTIDLQGLGSSRPRTRRSRSRLTSPPISKNWPAWGKTHLIVSRSSVNSAADSPSGHSGGH